MEKEKEEILKQINEEREIAEYLAQKLGVKDSLYISYIMTKEKKIYETRLYKELLESNKISPNDEYVYIKNIHDIEYFSPIYFCPFLYGKDFLPYAYLLKLALDSYGIATATQLKYMAMVIRFTNNNHVVVEVADIGTMATNTNLPMLTRGILRLKYITRRKVEDIESRLYSQKLFAGYNFSEARYILYRYYENHDALLAKDVESIRNAYKRIFKSFRIIYDLETKQFQVE